jgi:hypothetical protein
MLTADCIAAAAAVILFDMCVCVCDSLVPRPIITQQRLLLKFSFSCDYCQCRRSSWRSSASLNMSKRGFLIFLFFLFCFSCYSSCFVSSSAFNQQKRGLLEAFIPSYFPAFY